ncbi:MAG: hypothetical protein ACOZCO_08285 [Bacteroidota bacterium]
MKLNRILAIILISSCTSPGGALWEATPGLTTADSVYLDQAQKNRGIMDFNDILYNEFISEFTLTDSFRVVNRSTDTLFISTASSGHTVSEFSSEKMPPFTFQQVNYKSHISEDTKGKISRTITLLAETKRGKKKKLTYTFSMEIIPQKKPDGDWVITAYKTAETKSQKEPEHQVMRLNWKSWGKNTGFIHLGTFHEYQAEYVISEKGKILFLTLPAVITSACCPTEDDRQLGTLFDKIESYELRGDTLFLRGKNAFIKMVRAEKYFSD